MQAAEETLAGAVAETAAALDLKPADAAVVRLALVYAETIDAADDGNIRWAVSTIGPSLLRCLEALGATPQARRAGVGKRAGGRVGISELERLRAARRRGGGAS